MGSSYLVPKLCLGTECVEALPSSKKTFMGRSRNKIYKTEAPYFLTMTVVDWRSVFAHPDVAEIGLES